MQLPIVASLWIGGPLSYIEQLCLASWRDHGHRVVLYVYDDVPNVPEGVETFDARRILPRDAILRHSDTGSPAVHSYLFRYKLLEVQAVVWVDLDMLCLRPLDITGQWVFGWQVEGRRVGSGILGLPRFSKALAKLNGFCRDEQPVAPWLDEAEAAELRAKGGVHVTRQGLDLWGGGALSHFLRETDEISRIQPQSAFYGVTFKQRRDLIAPGRMVDDLLGDAARGVHLWNRRLGRWIRGVEDGVVPVESFLGRKLAEHGIDQGAAPLDGVSHAEPPRRMTDPKPAPQPAPVAEKAAPRPEPVAPKPAKPAAKPDRIVSATGGKGKRSFPVRKVRLDWPELGAAPMERRPIDPSLPTVASLWIGGTLSLLEQVCLLSFRDWGHRTVLYTYGEVARVPDGVEVLDANKVFPMENYIKHKNSGSPALHSDLFRYWMIKAENVVWIDTDVLCVRPWAMGTPFVYGWEKPPNLICGAVLGFPQNSKTLDALLEFCKDEYPIPPWASAEEKQRLQEAHDRGDPVHVTELKWGVWGPSALTYFLKETGEVEHTLQREAFYPVTFKDRRDLLEPDMDLSDRVGRGCYGVHLWNRRIRRRIVTNEVGLPHPDSLMGKALLRHRVDPLLALIPDTPPPGSPTRDEVHAKMPPHELAGLKAEFERRAAIYDAMPEKANASVAGTVEMPDWSGGRDAAGESSSGGSANRPDPDPEEEDIQETPEASRNPNVVVTPPAALGELPAMRLNQSPEYQQAIDDLEGRTGGITGYLKDPEQPIDNSRILVVTSMKNEAPFILEWIAYHKSIGVDHFLVYTNDCTDNTNEILDRLDALGHVTRVPNPWDPASGKKPQHVALKDALTQPAYTHANWVLTIDVDEFVNIHVGDGTFTDLFRASNAPNVISFTWKFFGNKDIHEYEDRPVTEQFSACAPEFIPKPRLGWGFKSMFHKSSPYTRIGVHRPLGIEDEEADQVRWVNGSGRAMPDMLLTNNGWRSTKRSVGYRLATLNHYILRSAESFLVKRERGRINHTEHDQGIEYWTRRNYATETDTRIHARLPRMHGVLKDLMADKKLAAMHADAVDWHKARITKLKADPDYRKLYDELTQPGRADALELAKAAEAEAQAEERAAHETMMHRDDKPAVSLRAAAPLQSLRMVSPPASAAAGPLHERFGDARVFAQRMKGFLWEGPANALMFTPRSRRLVVAFDNISIARAEGQRWPWGYQVLWQEMGCSVLGVMCTERNWYRQDFVHDAFEALRDQGFFEQFDEVLFYGTSMGGFGALVYSQCAPGSHVLAIAPQSTLDRAKLPGEERWGWTRKLDWSGRFADAAGAVDKAGEIFIVADPYFKPDFDQVDRVQGDNVTWLHTPFMGHQLPNAFLVMNILKDMLYAAAGGTLTPELFYKLFRARNDLPRYQHDLLMEAEKRGKIRSAIRVCEYTLARRKAANIRRTLSRLRDELAKLERKEAAE